jgi:hypothetical protein
MAMPTHHCVCSQRRRKTLHFTGHLAAAPINGQNDVLWAEADRFATLGWFPAVWLMPESGNLPVTNHLGKRRSAINSPELPTPDAVILSPRRNVSADSLDDGERPFDHVGAAQRQDSRATEWTGGRSSGTPRHGYGFLQPFSQGCVPCWDSIHHLPVQSLQSVSCSSAITGAFQSPPHRP